MAGGVSGFLGRFSATIAKLTELPKLILAAPSSSSSTPQGDVAGLQNDLEYVGRILRRIQAVLADAEEREVRDKSVRLWLSELQDLAYEADDLLDLYEYEVVAMEVRHREAANVLEGVRILTARGKRKSVDDQVCASITPSPRPPLQDPVFQKQLFDSLKKIKDRFEEFNQEIVDRRPSRVREHFIDLITIAKKKLQALGGTSSDLIASLTPSLRSPLQDPVFQKQLFDSVKKIKDRFEEIEYMKNSLHLKEHEGVRINKEIVDRQPTGSLPVEPEIIGRESDMSEVVTMLTSDDDTHVQTPTVVALVGMGGVGKTTLAQHAYNDSRVREHFREMGWVCVSDHSDGFDSITFAKKTLQALGGNSSDLIELSALQNKLKTQVGGKKFLLVMDDIWNVKRLPWDDVLSCLRCGATGSKILITTRSPQVADEAKATESIKIGFLPEESAWSLFRQHAFRRDGKSEDDHPVLVSIGREIAKKCGGLPLALRVLGRRLSDTQDDQLWRHVLENDLCEGEIWEEGGKQILGPLLLSYLHLPAHLKPCLKICNVFPKDHRIDRQDLVSLWMAHDLIMVKDRDNWMDLEDAAQRYMDNLVSRSFFQNAGYSWGEPRRYVAMHDLIHDLTQFLSHSSSESIISKFKGGNLRSLVSSRQANLCHTENLGCLRVVLWDKVTEPMIRSKHIRSLKLFHPKYNMIGPACELYNLRELRCRYHTGVEVPESIGNLKHLLSLHLTNVSSLPDSIGRLLNLRSLYIVVDYFMRLFMLPKSIVNLTNLQEIYMSSGRAITYFPVGIGRRRNLRRLGKSFVVPRISGQAGIIELRDLIYLEGRLIIEGLGNLLISEDAKQANLIQKANLRELELSWGKFHLITNEKDEFLEVSRRISCITVDDVQRDEQVLENLRPHPNLQRLDITGWAGLKLPSWLTEDPPYLTQLTSLGLSWCKRLDSLLPLGDMPRLEELNISNCRVDAIPVDSFSSTLKHLYLWGCFHLASIPLYKLIALESLMVDGCPQLQSIHFDDPVGAFSSVLESVWLNCCEALTMISLDKQVALLCVEVTDCLNLELISIDLSSVTDLQSLKVKYCKNLKDIRLGGPSSTVVDNNACLSELVLFKCPLLQKVPLPYLERGAVLNCGPLMEESFFGDYHPDEDHLYDSEMEDEGEEEQGSDGESYPKEDEL